MLSVHLKGNSHTGLLVTLSPSEEAVEASLTTLRFAAKAAEVRCMVRPVLISREQSLIVKQREIIKQLHSQVGFFLLYYIILDYNYIILYSIILYHIISYYINRVVVNRVGVVWR